MRLVASSSIAASVGFEEGVQGAIFDQAGLNATSALAALLQTSFERVVGEDTFYVLPNQSLPFQGNVFRTRLALSRGMLSSFSGVYYAESLVDLVNDSTSIETTYVAVDMEKGEVVITGPDLRNRFLKAGYVAGFEASAGLYQGVPEWLQQMAVMKAISIVDTVAPTLRMEDGAERSVKTLDALVAKMAEGHVRYFPSAVRPMG